ncbi:MAG: DUF1549 and DUF1553 domain-containing protein [Acidobacteria bacterium]|nr:DUF1549 and DUF1553 domain-containing protein [Acidobacteriota bacterium]MCI0722064.1 DUF1549 and DUF1553 domain-containing protein [Acidobacteriota bacterium]
MDPRTLVTEAGVVKSVCHMLCIFGLAVTGVLSFDLLCLAVGQATGGRGRVDGDKSQQAASLSSAATGNDRAGSLLSLRLVPEKVTLWGARGAQRFVVIGKYSDSMEQDVTAASRISLANPQVAQIAGSRVTARANGTTILNAELEGYRAETTIHVEDAAKERQPTFRREVETIFTRRGCNGSNCHGGVKGSGGFKLSLNGVYPREDYQWISEGGTYHVFATESSGPKIPRIDLKEPQKSLLLLKPTFSVPHGGGERFGVGSTEYQTLMAWILSGAPYGEENEGAERIERVEVWPRETVLDSAGRRQLLVTAHLSNGRWEDITDQVLYVSNNPEVVKVSSEGLVEAVKTGETAVLIRAPGYNVSASFGVISERIVNYPKIETKNFIDEIIFAKLRRFQVLPSELASDAEFLRRVCLDVTGLLPPASRVGEFLADQEPNKREKLLEKLLSSPQYVDYWTFRFADLFRIASQTNGSTKDSQFYWEWLNRNIAENKPYDQIARERIAAQGYDAAAKHYMQEALLPRLPPDAAAEEVRVFLGRRIDCAQCHNHPFENWSQDQFWGMTAFFRRLTFFWFLNVANDGDFIVADDRNGFWRLADMGKIVHPRTKKEVEPTFLDGTVLPVSQRKDPRLALGQWMTAQPEFAETAVNRMWSYFFGRGIVDPVDDFRSTNPPTHPELLKVLAQDFQRQRYDLKQLIRRIVHSRTYQLSSVPNETNAEDRSNFSRRRPRQLDAEILLDAISQVTEIPEIFQSGGGQAPAGTRAINLKAPDLYASQFLDIYGRPTREQLPDRNAEPNLRQALHRLVGVTFTEKLTREGGRIGRLLKSGASNRQIIEEFYLAAVSRLPSKEEMTGLESALLADENKGKSRRQVVEDLLWALLNSQEFLTS